MQKTKLPDVGPKLWNAFPRNVRNVTNCGIEQFKEALDCFLTKVPDEPKADPPKEDPPKEASSIKHLAK